MRNEEIATKIFEEEECADNDIGMFAEEELSDDKKVCGNLFRHKDYWKETGCSDFVYSVISEGYKPVFSEAPRRYKEKNNRSWYKNIQFGIQAVLKLKDNGRIVEVSEAELVAINPLSVAMHPQSKKLRLCLDHTWFILGFFLVYTLIILVLAE